MTGRDLVNDICARFPGAELSDPWGGGHDAWKIGGKMFACIGSLGDGVSVKCRDVETAAMLIDAGIARRAPYFHKSWVRLDWDAAEDEMRHRLEMSYDLIRSSLTKKLQASLTARQEA
ncbi:MmcQ/YjbR family DNA-binding protein [Roseibium sp.]|uniref:MmcQ/YjbR family DNA-binding protein n=1 Tax=Roseibium sp. TaxID=1936156 RepID=UPI003264CC7E